ncbi:MAG: PQQ-binding-like beta-propeller repeat protein, partial [Planctomycetota bacterium]
REALDQGSDDGTEQVHDEIEPTIRGDLSQVHLADIFQSLVMSQMEGVLRVNSSWQTAYVLHDNRKLRIILDGDSWLKRLNRRLLATGLVDAGTMKSLLRTLRRGTQSVRQLLLETGSLDEEQFHAIQSGLEEDAFFELFTLRRGTFAFFSEAFPVSMLEEKFKESVEFDAGQLLLEVARRSDEWEIILEEIGDLGEVFLVSREYRLGEHDELEETLLEEVDGSRSLADIAGGMLASLFDVSRTALDLYREGYLEKASTAHLLGLARADLEADNDAQARLYLKLIKQYREPTELEEHEELARLLIDTGDQKGGAEALAECARNCDEVERRVELLEQAHKLSARSVVILELLSATLIELDPEDPGEQYKEVNRDLCEIYLHKGNLEQALEVVENLQILDPDDLAIASRKAQILHKMDRLEEATSMLKEYAKHYREEGHRPRLIKTLEQILRIDPGNSKARGELLDLRSGLSRKVIRYGSLLTLAVLAVYLLWYSFDSYQRNLSGSKRLEEASGLVAQGNLTAGRRIAEELQREFGEGKVGRKAADLIVKIELKHRAKLQAERLRSRTEYMKGLKQAVDLFIGGDYSGSFQAYLALMEKFSKPKHLPLRKKIKESLEARFVTLGTQLEDELARIIDEGVDDPYDAVTPAQRKILMAKYDSQFPREKIELLTQLSAILLDARLHKIVKVPEGLGTKVRRYAEYGMRIDRARIQLKKLIKGDKDKLQMNDVYISAQRAEKELNFELASELYEQLSAEWTGAAGLKSYFDEQRARYKTILDELANIAEATKELDYRNSKKLYEDLTEKYPDIPFDQRVELPLSVRTKPEGAVVIVDGESQGETPLTLLVPPNQTFEIRVELQGYKTVEFPATPPANGLYRALLEMNPVWTKALDGDLTNQGAVHHERGALLLTDRLARVWALDLDTGKELWPKRTYPDLSGDLGSPLLIGSRAVLPARNGKVRCLDVETGEELWTVHCQEPVLSRAALVGRHAVLANEPGQLFVIDTDEGEEIRRLKLTGHLNEDCPPISDGKKYIFIVDKAGKIVATDDTGEILWTNRIERAGWTAPALQGDVLLVPSDDRRLHALSAEDGKLLWAADVGDALRHTPSLAGDSAYICTGNKELIELRLADGSIVKRQKLQGQPSAPPTVIGDLISVPVRKMGVYFVNRSDLEFHCLIANGTTTEIPLIKVGSNEFILATTSGRILHYHR